MDSKVWLESTVERSQKGNILLPQRQRQGHPSAVRVRAGSPQCHATLRSSAAGLS
ncbi:hypothetical protein OE88DRAFT_1656026 [Heliocybe sulcata]|uniref:Uncharacterized protein n=1 Tax=Heliocybe sulcata TaxID=5364 RepID=A0A5C3NBE0_9AGAM|nr:hypothetical protein OE88DRAFT_1656026 [Heliocybe sulcata]